MNRKVCGGCQGTDLEVVLDLVKSPLANAFLDSPDQPEELYPLRLVMCMSCFLVQMEYVVPDSVLFDNNMFYTGTSSPELQEPIARKLMNRYGDNGPLKTLEIGCNDGSLMHYFDNAGWPIVGVDPAQGPAQMARDRGLDVLGMPFGTDAAEGIRAESGQMDLIIGNNVLAHVSDLNDFLEGVRRLLKPDGRAVFQFQYLGDLVAGNMFDHVYHEHRYFFSLDALQEQLIRHGLVPNYFWRTTAQGGSIQAEITHGTTGLRNLDPWLHSRREMLSLQSRATYIVGKLLSLIGMFKNVAGYGASAKSTTLLNYARIDTLDYIVDLTPVKWGKYTPGTHIPIISPEQEQERDYPDAYLLLVWNYLGRILRESKDYFGPDQQSAKWIVPIPFPQVL